MPPKSVAKNAVVAAPAPAVQVSTIAAPSAQVGRDLSKMKKDFRVVDLASFDPSRLIIHDPVKKEEPGAGSSFSMYVDYQYDENTYGPLMIQPGQLFCFGVTGDNYDPKTKKNKLVNGIEQTTPSGFSAAIPLSSTDKDSPETRVLKNDLISFFDLIKGEISSFVVEHKNDISFFIGKKDSTVEDAVADVYFRNKSGDPTLYVPLMFYKSKDGGPGKMETHFYSDQDDVELDPSKQDRGFNMIPTIKLQRVYTKSAGKVSMKVQLYDATVSNRSSLPSRRLAPKKKVEDLSEEVHGDATEMGESGEE